MSPEEIEDVYNYGHDHAYPMDHSLSEESAAQVQHIGGLRAVARNAWKLGRDSGNNPFGEEE